jgi:hypothetical protein
MLCYPTLHAQYASIKQNGNGTHYEHFKSFVLEFFLGRPEVPGPTRAHPHRIKIRIQLEE